jgi:hypothetical protein
MRMKKGEWLAVNHCWKSLVSLSAGAKNVVAIVHDVSRIAIPARSPWGVSTALAINQPSP